MNRPNVCAVGFVVACLVSAVIVWPAPIGAQQAPSFQSVSAGDRHTCALDRAGVVYCWGSAADGAVGAAKGDPCGVAAACVRRPVAVSGDGFTSVSAGFDHTCALMRDETPWCAGNNRQGALGTGSRERGRTFAPTGGGPKFESIAAGREFTCGIAGGGVAYCWGRGTDGQLGRSALADTALPVAVETPVHFTVIATGWAFTCGVGTDSVAYCWGRGREGQLGTDTTLDRPTPVPVAGELRFRTVTAGADHACGLTTDSLAYCWGRGREGQLGTAERRDGRRPAPVTGGIKFVALSAGRQFTCGVSADGAAFCWGPDRGSKVGGSYATRDGRRAVGGVIGALEPLRYAFRTVSAGSAHACGVVFDWSIWCWGDGETGQLGNSAVPSAYAPIRVVRP